MEDKRKPTLNRVIRRAHAQLTKEVDETVALIKECQKPFPENLAKHQQYIRDRLPGGKYSAPVQREAYDKLIVLDGECLALHQLAYRLDIVLAKINGIKQLIGAVSYTHLRAHET